MNNKYHTTSATARRFALAFLGLVITGTVYLTAYSHLPQLTGAIVRRPAQTFTRPAEPMPRPRECRVICKEYGREKVCKKMCY